MIEEMVKRGRKKIDLTGMKFGRLTVIRQSDRAPSSTSYYWHCVCECGGEREVVSGSLRRGATTSCGCYQREKVSVQKSKYTVIGFYKHPLRPVWVNMIKRCTVPSDRSYKHYGGRGITVCERWHKFENFIEDMGERPAGMTIERIDTNGNYEPGNCRWATQLEQVRNRRITRFVEIDGKRMAVAECAEKFGISLTTLVWRLYRANWTIEQALEMVHHPDMRKRAVKGK